MRFKKLGILAVGLISSASVAFANGFHSNGTDAASFGQATAGITGVESAATSANLPAAIPYLEEGTHALISITHLVPDFEYKAEGSDKTEESKAAPITGPSIYAAWTNNKLGLGFSVTTPFYDQVEWKDGEDFSAASSAHSAFIRATNFSAVASYKVGDLSFGGGINYYDAEVKIKQVQPQGAIKIPITLEGTGQTAGYTLSAMYNANRFAIGLNHQSKVTIPGKGTADFDQTNINALPNIPAKAQLLAGTKDQDVELDLKLPAVTRFAISFKDKKKDPDYLIEAVATHTGWSAFDELRIEWEDGRNDTVYEKKWKDTVGYQLGGNYVFYRGGDTNMRVRFGYLNDPTPIPSDKLDPMVPDSGRTAYSTGLGFKKGKFLTDVSYLYEIFEEKNSTYKDSAGNASGKYKGIGQVLAVNFGYRW